MKIYIGADYRGFEKKEAIKGFLLEKVFCWKKAIKSKIWAHLSITKVTILTTLR